MRIQSKLIGGFLAGSLFLAALSFAQGLDARFGFRHGMPALKQALDLTDEQVKQLIDNQRQRHEALKPIFQAIREKRQQLQQLLEGTSPDPQQVGQLVIETKQLENQIKQVSENFAQQARSILTATQQEKLNELQRALELAPAAHAAAAMQLITPPRRSGGGGEATPAGFGGMRFPERPQFFRR